MSESPHKQNTKLMRDMGSHSGEWDPIPPRQYEAFAEDSGESPRLRIWAALLSRTIHADANLKRWASAREPKTGQDTKPLHLVAELDLHKSEVSETLDALAKEGRIRRDQGKIWLCAEVPVPQNARAKKSESVHCTVNFSEKEALFLKDLEKSDPERFHAGIVAIIVAEEWGAKLQADAIAWAREHKTEARRQVFTEIGYTSSENRGATKKRAHSNGAPLQPALTFAQFTVQRTAEIERQKTRFTVQDEKLVPYTILKNSVQTAHPYRPEVESSEQQLASQGRPTAKAETRQAELNKQAAEREAGTEIRNEISARLRRAGLKKLGAVEIDTGTIGNLTRHFQRLATAGEVRDVLDVLEERARELKTGKRVAEGWGYLVNVVKSECDKRDVRAAIKTAAAGKGWS